MSDRFIPSILLTALALTLPWPAAAQEGDASMSAAEQRAQREAERVFSVIKFHTSRSKPAVEAASKPPRPPAPPVHRPAPVAARAEPSPAPAPAAVAAVAAEPTVAATVELTPPAAPPVAMPVPAPTPVAAAPVLEEASAAAPTQQEPEPDAEADDADDEPLRMQSFVAPVLTPAVQATLGAGERHVRVRLTVEADGHVSQAEAVAGVPRRLARPAVDAILQWQFAPLAQPRTAEVEIAFRRD